MDTRIGKYDYQKAGENVIFVKLSTIKYDITTISVVSKIEQNGDNISIIINKNNPDFLEIYTNGMKIFNGEIILS